MKEFFKKLLLCSGILIAFFATPLLQTENASAASNTFLGMESWSAGVSDASGNLFCVNQNGAGNCMPLSTFIWTIVLTISKDLSILAAYLALGFIVYGGYMYMFSSGNPGKAEKGKRTLINSAIGLAITMLANVIFTTIRFVLSQGASSGSAGGVTLPNNSAAEVFSNVFGWFVGVAGIVAVIFLIYGGVMYITSAGDASKLTTAKRAILYSLIGLAIVGLSEAILAFVVNTVDKSTSDTALVNNITIAKELYEK